MDQNELLKMAKPSRYMNGEVNSVHKDFGRVRLKFALAFPDVYEVGMSHLGLQILYHILNQDPEIACERVFAPWPDMERYLRERSLPLTSLESSLPLRSFEIIGFSLQYELNYTGVLTMLHLSGIPFRAAERGEGDPLIIGGGPCAMNPEPIADFFDLLVLGDGEEVILEICREHIAAHEEKASKEELLVRLSRIIGVYVPSFFRIDYKPDGQIREVVSRQGRITPITRRVLADLNQGAFPASPVLPFMEIIHDRLNIEVARGCTRGCRFCQAGMIHRPLRERSPQKILQLVASGLRQTGYDEVSLLSLSTGDYSCLEPLLTSIIDLYGPEQVAVSFPSLRVETLTPELVHKIKGVRKTGFTLAPEAGTERLRRVINKGNTAEDLISAIRTIFAADWRLVKLYFMIGLPTEQEEDLQGIVSLCRRALQEARRTQGPARIHMSISTFIPKAHTPFQWEPQSSLEEIQQKQKFLRQNLDRHGLQTKWTDARLSLLEGAFARGDRRLSPLLEAAYRSGCRLDGWGDHFRYDLWEKAFSQAGVDPFFYTHRPRDLEEILPWDHLASRVSKGFLIEERRKAFAGIATLDCRHASCQGCGVCHGSSMRGPLKDGEAIPSAIPLRSSQETWATPPIICRFRAQYTKLGPARLLSHLELVQAIVRTFRRAGIPLSYSRGFHPLPRLSFGPPLPVGYESFAEFLDFFTPMTLHAGPALSLLNSEFPSGIKFLKTKEIPLKSPSIFDNIIKILYVIRFPKDNGPSLEKADFFAKKDTFPIFWPRKNKELELKSAIESLSFINHHVLKVMIRSGKEGTVKPEEALEFIFDWNVEDSDRIQIQKFKVFFKDSF